MLFKVVIHISPNSDLEAMAIFSPGAMARGRFFIPTP
jgi:hypothetical protein